MTVRQMARLGGLASAEARSPDERVRLARWAVAERWRKYRERLAAGIVEVPEI